MIESLKKNLDFKKVYEYGSSFANRYLVMYVLKNDRSINRIGISVSKKTGNSVVRHRLIRLIRECCRLNQDRLKNGFDIVIIVRISARGKNLKEISEAVLHLAGKHKIIKEMIDS